MSDDAKPFDADGDPDLDDDGNLDVEQFPLPAGLVAAAEKAGIDLDE